MYFTRILIITILSLQCISVYSQIDTTVKVAEYDGWKKGKNTFSTKLSIANLEKFVLGNYTVKAFENSLGNYEKRWYGSDTVREGGIIKSIYMPYTIRTGTNDFNIVYITFNTNQKISKITFTAFEDNIRINKMGAFINGLKANGYVLSLAYERMVERYGDVQSDDVDHQSGHCDHPHLKVVSG